MSVIEQLARGALVVTPRRASGRVCARRAAAPTREQEEGMAD
jgi:hypothetical protein